MNLEKLTTTNADTAQNNERISFESFNEPIKKPLVGNVEMKLTSITKLREVAVMNPTTGQPEVTVIFRLDFVQKDNSKYFCDIFQNQISTIAMIMSRIYDDVTFNTVSDVLQKMSERFTVYHIVEDLRNGFISSKIDWNKTLQFNILN